MLPDVQTARHLRIHVQHSAYLFELFHSPAIESNIQESKSSSYAVKCVSASLKGLQFIVSPHKSGTF